MMTTILKSTLLFFVISILIYLGYQSFQNANKYIQVSKQISQGNDTSKSVQKRLNQFLEEISLGIYDKYSDNQHITTQQSIQANNYHATSIQFIYYFFTTIILFWILFYFLDPEFLLIFIGLSALISLITALFSPLLIMTVYKSFPLIGEVTLSYDTKSIYTTITKLISQSNYLVALLVLLFSVMIPLLKALLIITYGFLKETGFARNLAKFIEKIGKWSMADVFIVAVLVVFFSTKQDIHSSIKIEIGLYFFIGYVLLSMLGSTMLTENKNTQAP